MPPSITSMVWSVAIASTIESPSSGSDAGPVQLSIYFAVIKTGWRATAYSMQINTQTSLAGFFIASIIESKFIDDVRTEFHACAFGWNARDALSCARSPARACSVYSRLTRIADHVIAGYPLSLNTDEDHALFTQLRRYFKDIKKVMGVRNKSSRKD